MAILQQSARLRKELSLLGVFAIATGTTLSAGFFLLPGLAAEQAGPAVVLSYVIAALLVVPAMLSIVELATAMPRAGGAYYFLDRSLGPVAGTVGGLGTWLALVLKSAFALVGMGAYIGLLFDMVGDRYPATGQFLHRFGPYSIAAGLAVFFGFVNLLGARKTGGMQKLLVFGLLVILTGFIAQGGTHVQWSNFTGFFDAGFDSIVATAGLVFISYVGVTNVASISEEVKDPERNLPLGIFFALGTSVVVYILGISVMVGVMGPALAGSTDPETGEHIHSGVTRRRPTVSQRRQIESRDRYCSFPGCRMPSTDCDIDHTIPYSEGGATCPCNNAPGCRHDHILKEYGWTYVRLADGRYQWTSPLGHTYTTWRSPP